MPEFRTLSIRQPFVEEIFRGKKKIEYRSWNVEFTGLLAIHASSSREELENLDKKELRKLFPNGVDESLGCIVGIVVLDHCDNGEWHLKKPRRLVKPFVTKGAARIFFVDIPAEYLPDDVKQELDSKTAPGSARPPARRRP